MIIDGGGLPGFDAIGAFLGKQDLDGGKDQTEVQHHGHFADVDQIHFQLVIGCGVVPAVDLRKAGQTGLDLQTQGECVRTVFSRQTT